MTSGVSVVKLSMTRRNCGITVSLKKKYVELKPSRCLDGTKSEDIEALSILGAIQKACMKVKEENQSSSIDTDKVTEHALALLVNMNHTGNHYRNHYMNVGSNIYGNLSGAK